MDHESRQDRNDLQGSKIKACEHRTIVIEFGTLVGYTRCKILAELYLVENWKASVMHVYHRSPMLYNTTTPLPFRPTGFVFWDLRTNGFFRRRVRNMQSTGVFIGFSLQRCQRISQSLLFCTEVLTHCQTCKLYLYLRINIFNPCFYLIISVYL